MPDVIENRIMVTPGEDATFYIKLMYEDMRQKTEAPLGANDYFMCICKYESGDECAPELFRIKTTSRLLNIPASITSTLMPGKYSLDIWLYTEQTDGTFRATQVYPSYKYMKIPQARIVNNKCLIVCGGNVFD